MPRLSEGVTSALVKMGVMGGVTTAVGPVAIDPKILSHADSIEEMFPDATDAHGLAAEGFSQEAQIVSGPWEGGALLDRPIGDVLATSAQEQSLGLEPSEMTEAQHMAKAIEGVSRLNVGGIDVDVMDFVPGGDFVQALSGNLSPDQMLMKAGTFAAHHLHGTHLADGPGARGLPGQGAPSHILEQLSPGHANSDSDGAGEIEDLGTGFMPRLSKGGRPKITLDADTKARDTAELMDEHKKNMATSVEAFDSSVVHTQIHRRGRTMSVDTSFEARHSDNRHEKDVAEDHVEKAEAGLGNEAVTEKPRMHFRSIMKSIADAENDEGLTI